MQQILCSTGALLGRANNRDYNLLEKISKELQCDGYEFLVYGSWYPEIDKLLSTVKSFDLNIPVIHARKSLGESLCGMRVWREGNTYPVYVMTEEEDKKAFQDGIEEFKLNLRIAQEFGADKMVLHLWNGLVSDKNIEKNIERFGILKDLAVAAGVELMVENVICNTHDPLHNLELLHKVYPEVSIVYDTKMAEFHRQTMKVFEPEHEWMFKEGNVKHLHINDYAGGYKDWRNFNVLPIGKGHVDFDAFFGCLANYSYNGDYTIEATGFDRTTGDIDIDMLNECIRKLREYI